MSIKRDSSGCQIYNKDQFKFNEHPANQNWLGC